MTRALLLRWIKAHPDILEGTRRGLADIRAGRFRRVKVPGGHAVSETLGWAATRNSASVRGSIEVADFGSPVQIVLTSASERRGYWRYWRYWRIAAVVSVLGFGLEGILLALLVLLR